MPYVAKQPKIEKLSDFEKLKGYKQATKDALKLVWQGKGFKEASMEAGASLPSVKQAAVRLGIGTGVNASFLSRYKKSKGEVLADEMRELAHLANQELLARLREPDKRAKMSEAQLNMIAGTNTDKIAKKERWGEKERLDNNDALRMLAERFLEMKDFRITIEGGASAAPQPMRIEDAKVIEDNT